MMRLIFFAALLILVTSCCDCRRIDAGEQIAVEQAPVERHQPRQVGPQEGANDLAAGIDAGQGRPIGGHLSQIAG